MSLSKVLQVSEKDALKRLDVFLAENYPDLSRSKLVSLIEKGIVKVNSQVKKNSYKVCVGDIISVQFIDKKIGSQIQIETNPVGINPEFDQDQDQDLDPDLDLDLGSDLFNQEQHIEPKEYPINVVYEDESILVVDKPAGLVVHPGVKTKDNPTLVEAVAYYLKSKYGMDSSRVPRSGLVHRLDQDTSGLIVFAKEELAHKKLACQFKEKTNLREYTALLGGYLKEESVDVESYLVRSKFNRMSFKSLDAKELEGCAPDTTTNIDPEDRYILNFKGQAKHRILVDKNGRKARYSCSHFRKIVSYDHKLSLVKVRLDTGRTHQIRVHAKDIGAPVVGDTLYAKMSRLVSIDPVVDEVLKKVPRQLLHAGLLGIIHPRTQEKICFRSELPQDFQKVLYILEKLEDN